jgi:hypothetical protein
MFQVCPKVLLGTLKVSQPGEILDGETLLPGGIRACGEDLWGLTRPRTGINFIGRKKS